VGTITTGALTVLPFVHAFGDTLGTFNGFRYFIGADGTYALSLWVAAQDIGVSYNVDVITRASFTATAQAEAVHFQAITGLPNSGGASVFAVTRPFVAGDQIDVRAAQDSGFNARLNLYGGLCQIA
jgi:hypothetical protein